MSPLRYRLALARMRPTVIGVALLALGGLAAVAWLLLAQAPTDERSNVLVAPAVTWRPPAGEPDAARVGQTTAAVEPDSDLVEVCGLGWVELNDKAKLGDVELLEQIPGFSAARRVLVDGLRESPDEFARAAALMLDMAIDAGGFDPVPIESLAHQAVTSDDGRVYALAFRTCAASSAEGSCALLNPAQWARLDEGNAAPWLFLLDQAAARGDRAQVDEALYRIGSAKRFDDRFAALAVPILERAGGADADLVAAEWLAAQVTSKALALPMPVESLAKACGIEAVADANRRQTCDAAATTLAERSDSLLVSMIGASIGKRVGWPSDRVLAARALAFVSPEVRESSSHGSARASGGAGCDDVRADIDRLALLAQVGEPQLRRDWLAANGKSLAPYVEAAREIEAKQDAVRAQLATSRAASAPAASPLGEQR